MTLCSHSINKTYYDILNVKEDATYEEIRQSYRLALLQSHPDKLPKSLNSPNTSNDLSETFQEIQKAWETLSISKSRALYDNKLLSLRSYELAADDIALNNMMVEDNMDGLEFLHRCRCGDYFLISSSELEEMGYQLGRNEREIFVRTPKASLESVVIPCGSCSLRIRVLIDMNCSVLVDDENVKL